jgi:hypothetical protein
VTSYNKGQSVDATVPIERISSKIYLIRGQKVMLDRDLANLYEVETRALNQAISRNKDRFPGDFVFELTREEIMRISQIVTSSKTRYSLYGARCGNALFPLLSAPCSMPFVREAGSLQTKAEKGSNVNLTLFSEPYLAGKI